MGAAAEIGYGPCSSLTGIVAPKEPQDIMKAACPRCGTMADHEEIVSTVRTWFLCADCSFFWRGSLLATANGDGPLETVPDSSAMLSEDELDRKLARLEEAVEGRAEIPMRRPSSDPIEAPEPAVESGPTRPRLETKGLDQWCSAVDDTAAARQPRVAAPRYQGAALTEPYKCCSHTALRGSGFPPGGFPPLPAGSRPRPIPDPA